MGMHKTTTGDSRVSISWIFVYVITINIDNYLRDNHGALDRENNNVGRKESKQARNGIKRAF